MNKITASVKIKIPFFDTDPMGVAWHGNYIKYFEIARCALLDKIGYNYNQMMKDGYTYPIIKLNVKYVKSIYFNQDVEVTASLKEYENNIVIEYLITAANDTKEKLCKAETTQVAVNSKNNEMLYETPKIFKQKIEALIK